MWIHIFLLAVLSHFASHILILWCSVWFSHSDLSNSLWPHGLQHSRLSCPSPTPAAYSNSRPLSWWYHPTISSSVIPFSHFQSFPESVSTNESVLQIRWPKYGSFSCSISPTNQYPVLISFRMDWLDLLGVQGTQESSPTPQFKSTDSLGLTFIYCLTLTSIHDYWKNQSFD